MSKVRPPYPVQFKQQMVELVRAGRTPAELSREFNVSAQSITNWIGQTAIDSGKPLPGKEGLTCVEREALVRLRRQLRQVQQERDILAKATAWFAGRSDATSTKSSDSRWQPSPTFARCTRTPTSPTVCRAQEPSSSNKASPSADSALRASCIWPASRASAAAVASRLPRAWPSASAAVVWMCAPQWAL